MYHLIPWIRLYWSLFITVKVNKENSTSTLWHEVEETCQLSVIMHGRINLNHHQLNTSSILRCNEDTSNSKQRIRQLCQLCYIQWTSSSWWLSAAILDSLKGPDSRSSPALTRDSIFSALAAHTDARRTLSRRAAICERDPIFQSGGTRIPPVSGPGMWSEGGKEEITTSRASSNLSNGRKIGKER